jgi:hypothetical protein
MLATLLTAIPELKEPSKTGFYVVGGLLVIWACALTFYGMRSPNWPPSKAGQRLVILLTALLVAGTMVAAVATS